MDWIKLVLFAGPFVAAGAVAAAVWSLVRLFRTRGAALVRSVAGWRALAGSVFTLGLSALAFAMLVNGMAPMRQAYDWIDRPAPAFAFSRLDAPGEHRIADFEGQVVVFNIWATWCPPCLREMPALDSLQQAYADRGVVVLAISDEPADEVEAFFETRPSSVVKGLVDREVWREGPYAGIARMRPVTFIIDRKGIVRESLPGERTFDVFAGHIEPYL